MKKLFLLLFFVSFGLVGCSGPQTSNATEEKLQSVLDQWLGHKKSEVLLVFGQPSYDYVKDDVNYLVYIKNKVSSVSQGATIERLPRVHHDTSLFQTPTSLVTQGCTILFLVQEDQVVQWRYEGNNCKAF